MPVPVIAINVALAQISMGAEFVRDVMDSIARGALKPSDIELDVTERVLARATLAQSSVLEELRRSGIAIAIDNFGAQYSSLDYLRTYRVSRLKIARGMIAAADAEPGGSAMIRAILSLARELGIEVVAEGRRNRVRSASCWCRRALQAQGQGFFYSRAVPAQETMRCCAGARRVVECRNAEAHAAVSRRFCDPAARGPDPRPAGAAMPA